MATRFGRASAAARGVIAAVALAGPCSAAPAPKPRHIMSLNQCTDQLLLMLVEPERIASVSYLAQDGTVSPFVAAQARKVKVNHGQAEEVLNEKPDLVLAGTATTPMTRQLLRRLKAPILEQTPATSFDDIRNETRAVGAAVGEPERAEAWIRRMDATLGELRRTAPTKRIAAAAWSGTGRVSGVQSLFDAILSAAGGYNVAAGKGEFERSLDIEQLLNARPRPDILLYGTSARSKVGIQADAVSHPALLRLLGRRRIAYPMGEYICGTPYAADTAVGLRKAMLAALAAPNQTR